MGMLSEYYDSTVIPLPGWIGESSCMNVASIMHHYLSMARETNRPPSHPDMRIMVEEMKRAIGILEDAIEHDRRCRPSAAVVVRRMEELLEKIRGPKP